MRHLASLPYPDHHPIKGRKNEQFKPKKLNVSLSLSRLIKPIISNAEKFSEFEIWIIRLMYTSTD